MAFVKAVQNQVSVETQAVIVKKSYGLAKARAWVKSHGFEPIKPVHVTTNYYRFRIQNPKKFKRFYLKTVNKSVKLVIGR